MDCLNLKERFGRRYRVAHEAAISGQRERFPADPWLQVILCRNGHIAPWGQNLLAACTRKGGPIANRLKRLPFATVAQDASDGVNVVFHVEHFAEVAKIMRPRRRRQLTEAQRQQAAGHLARIRANPCLGTLFQG